MVVLSPKNEGQVGSHGTPYFSQKRGASLGPTDFFAIESSDFRWGRKQAIRNRALNHVYP